LCVVSGLNEFHKIGLLHNNIKEDNVIVCYDDDNKKEEEEEKQETYKTNNKLKYPLLKLKGFERIEKEEITKEKKTKTGTPMYFV
jgi:serine/threonine protein kinase